MPWWLMVSRFSGYRMVPSPCRRASWCTRVLLESGHGGLTATRATPRPCCVWSDMEPAVQDFVCQCLNCTDSKGEWSSSPTPIGGVAAWSFVGEALHFHYFHLEYENN